MGTASFVMVLIGCVQGNPCSPIATLPAAYRTEVGCLAARAEIVAAVSGAGFDRVFAECRSQETSRQTSVAARPAA